MSDPANDTRRRMVFTLDDREALRNAYCEHVDKMADDPKVPDSFTFQGDTYLVVYAHYLLEYLDSRGEKES